MGVWIKALLIGAAAAIGTFILLVVVSAMGIYDMSLGAGVGLPLVLGFMAAKSQFKKPVDKNGNTSVEEDKPDYDLIWAYGEVIEKYADAVVTDIDFLPAPKEKIKKEIKFAISDTTDATLKDVLRAAYIQLSAFQMNVGSDPVIDNTAELLNIPREDTAKFADAVLASMQEQDEIVKWREIVSSEMTSLMEESNSF